MLEPHVLHIAIAAVAVAGIALLLILWLFFSDSKKTQDDKDYDVDTAATGNAESTQRNLTRELASGPDVGGLRQRTAAVATRELAPEEDPHQRSGQVQQPAAPLDADVIGSRPTGVRPGGTAGAKVASGRSDDTGMQAAATPARAQAAAAKPEAAIKPKTPAPPTVLQKRTAEWKDLWLLRLCAVSRLVDNCPGPIDRSTADKLKLAIWRMLDDRPRYVATGCADGQARIFELNTGRMLVSVRHDVSSRAPIGAVLMAPGPSMLTGTWDGRIHDWDEWPDKPARPEEFNRGEKYIGHENLIMGLAMSRDQHKIVSACSAGKVLIFRRHCETIELLVSDPEEIQKLKESLKIGDHSELYLLEDLVLGGKQLLWGDEFLKEADFEGKCMRRELDKLTLPARLRFRFAGCLTEGHPRSWRQMSHDDTVLCMAVSAEGAGEFIYSGSRDRTVRKWSLADASHVHTYTGHSSMVRCLAVNSRYLVSGGDDRKVRVWRKDVPELVRAIPAHDDFVHALALCSTFPERLVSAGFDGRVVLWDVSTGEELLEFKHPAAATGSIVTALRLHESTLFSCCSDKQLRVWCTESGKLERQMRHAGSVTSVSLL